MEDQNIILTPEEAEQLLSESLRDGGLFPIRVTGNSMIPFLKEKRDTVWLRSAGQLRRGDILFFRRRDGSLILHRIRRLYPDGRMLVNGDAQAWCEIVFPDQVLAVAQRIVRADGSSVSPDSLGQKIARWLWYPTRPVRPLLFRIYLFFRRLFSSSKKH